MACSASCRSTSGSIRCSSSATPASACTTRSRIRSSSSPEVLDSVVSAETPEGILLEMRPAGLSARFCAFAIDWLIRIAILYGAMMVAGVLGGVGIAFWLILAFVLEWFYAVFFELGQRGATPGKRAMDLKVVMDNGLPITPAASVTRNLLRAADFMPLAYGSAIVCMLLR